MRDIMKDDSEYLALIDFIVKNWGKLDGKFYDRIFIT